MTSSDRATATLPRAPVFARPINWPAAPHQTDPRWIAKSRSRCKGFKAGGLERRSDLTLQPHSGSS